MSEQSFRVQHIDHVEVFVPNQYDAAAWYRAVLGLEIMPELEHWAAVGPLVISSDGGMTKLALFRGEPRGQRPTAGHHRVAFRVDGLGFLTFLQRSSHPPVFADDGQPLHELRAVDHKQAWSTYFCDPYGNRYEVTTYDYDYVSEHRGSQY